MKRAVFLIPLLVLLVLTFTASPAAASVEGVPVETYQFVHPSDLLPKTGINKGGILHVYYSGQPESTLGLDLHKDDSIDYIFSSTIDFEAIIDTATGEGVMHFWTTWTKTSGSGGDGTFKGQASGKIIDYTYDPDGTPFEPKFGWAGYVHAVLHGSGVFKGQTLMLDGTREKQGDPGPFTSLHWEGSLLTH